MFQGFVAAYRSILEAAGSPDNQCEPFRTIVETLASSPTPILVHCSAGKDREWAPLPRSPPSSPLF